MVRGCNTDKPSPTAQDLAWLSQQKAWRTENLSKSDSKLYSNWWGRRFKAGTPRQHALCYRPALLKSWASWTQGSNTDRQGLTAQELAWLATMPNSARPASKNKTGLSKLVPKKSWIPGVSSKKQRGGPGSEASDTPRILDQVCTLQCPSCAADSQRKHYASCGGACTDICKVLFGHV